MKKYILFYLLLFLVFFAYSQPIRCPLSDEELLKPYKEKGIELSDIPPAPGYHSPKKAVLETRKDLCIEEEYINIPPEKYAERRFVYDAEVTPPVLVHNFLKPKYIQDTCDFHYVIFDTHPLYGTTRIMAYRFNENSNINFGFSMSGEARKIPEKKSYLITKNDAINYMEHKFNIKIQKEPIAVLMPIGRYTDELEGWMWYFDIEGKGEFLLGCSIYEYNPEKDLFEQIETSFSPEHDLAMLFKPSYRLNLYERVAKKKEDINYYWYIIETVELIPVAGRIIILEQEQKEKNKTE